MGRCGKCGDQIAGSIGLCITCFVIVHQTCPKCGGRGRYKRPINSRAKHAKQWVVCTTCDGRGVCKIGTPITED